MKVIVILLSILFGTTADAQTCEPINFAAGESSARIDGVLPPKNPSDATEPACLSLAVRQGQYVTVSIEGDENVVASIPGVGDARQLFDFAAPSDLVELLMFQLFPSPREASFSLTVRVE